MGPRTLAPVLLSATLLCGCSSSSTDSLVSAAPPPPSAPAVASAPAAYPVSRLIGNWGVASYRDEKDRGRVEAQARSQCKLPYVIAAGPTDGVLMHVADDPDVHELTLKGGPGGKTYLGFAGPPGDTQDLEILSINDKMFVARYVDPDTNARYGTLVYVRCKPA